jgi:hypothetical protein
MISKQLIIVYHLFQASGWEQLFSEQMGLLFVSGLLDNAHLTISVNGTSPVPSIGHEIIYRTDGFSEKPSLLLARQYAEEFPNSRILYFHSKGISHPTKNQDDWRMMMQHFILVKWKEAVALLDDHDVVGVNWRTFPVPHSSGNYWWANASFLQKLDFGFLNEHDRMSQEFWIGSVPGKIANMHETNLDHYNQACPSSSYCSSYFKP